MENFKYQNKPLTEYFTSQLEAILSGLQAAETKRNEASKHEKFNVDTKKPKMEFPPPNPNFLILKSEIQKELDSRKNNNA